MYTIATAAGNNAAVILSLSHQGFLNMYICLKVILAVVNWLFRNSIDVNYCIILILISQTINADVLRITLISIRKRRHQFKLHVDTSVTN